MSTINPYMNGYTTFGHRRLCQKSPVEGSSIMGISRRAEGKSPSSSALGFGTRSCSALDRRVLKLSAESFGEDKSGACRRILRRMIRPCKRLCTSALPFQFTLHHVGRVLVSIGSEPLNRGRACHNMPGTAMTKAFN